MWLGSIIVRRRLSWGIFVVRWRLRPRFKKITFHTFRHWKASTEYHKTKDILHIMEMLGHRDIKTTLIYTQLVTFESDEYNSSTAKTTKEAEELVESGFEYICTTPQDVMLFRKRK
jgi:integrase